MTKHDMIRTCPVNPKYAVSRDGCLYSRWSGEGKRISLQNGNSEYPASYARMYKPNPVAPEDKYRRIRHTIKMANLMVMTFPEAIPNSDKLEDPGYTAIHLDGDPFNCAVDNIRIIKKWDLRYHMLWLETGITRKDLRRYRMKEGTNVDKAQEMAKEFGLTPKYAEYLISSPKYKSCERRK